MQLREECVERSAEEREGHDASDEEQEQYSQEDQTQSNPQQRGHLGQHQSDPLVSAHHCRTAPVQDVDRPNFPLLPRESASQVRAVQLEV